MERYYLIYLCIFATLISCSSIEPKLGSQLTKLSSKIKTGNTKNFRDLFTDKGYNSILSWSDSLRNKNFLIGLSDNLSDEGKGVFSVTDNDSLIYLSLGISEVIVGATGGYLI